MRKDEFAKMLLEGTTCIDCSHLINLKTNFCEKKKKLVNRVPCKHWNHESFELTKIQRTLVDLHDAIVEWGMTLKNET
jgi:hypothetical protein